MTETNQLTREITSEVYPAAVLVAYADEERKTCFLEMRAVDRNGNM